MNRIYIFQKKRFNREFHIQNWKNCPGEKMMAVEGKMPVSHLNVVSFSGYGYLSRDIKGDLELFVEVNRCSLDMKFCENYPGTTIRELCKRFRDKNAFYSSTLESIKPLLKCPVKAGNYTFMELKLDLSALSLLPMDGYVWLTTIKLLSAEERIKRKLIVLCIAAETKILRSSIKDKKS